MTSVTCRRFRFHCLPWLAGALLSAGALAEEPLDYRELPVKTLPNYMQEVDNRSFESIKYGKDLKVKGLRFGEGIYFGGVKVNGEYGPGVVFDRGGYVWGFNHEQIQLRWRF